MANISESASGPGPPFLKLLVQYKKSGSFVELGKGRA